MFDSPSPLPQGAVIDSFTPDATLAWLIAYAGPCGDPECKQDGIPGGHTRLYLIPMIGWQHALVTDGGVILRPAIMSSGGSVVDYLNVPATFQFIAIVRATEDAAEVARGLYRERVGSDREMIIERPPALAN